MERFARKKMISLPLVIAMIANPALAEMPSQAAIMENRQRLLKNHQGVVHSAASAEAVRRYNAGIMVDEQASRELQAGIKESANGTTVIDIAEASARGVSHNQFTSFNVDENGVILNNSLAPVLTQLGGWTDGNRRLTGGEARIILNEVTGSTRSDLLGTVEIAGQSAEFILANENGITCNGCGFINVPRATLVTGSAVMSNGGIDGFNLGNGSFIAEGDGINASSVDRFDIVTRAAQINADLYASELNIYTGNDYFDYQTSAISSTEGATNAPQVALDVSALGGMYAHSIYLVGTEKGLGVNSEGLIQSVESLEISADGDIRLKDTLANESIVVASAAGSVETFGQLYSDSVTISADQGIVNTGFLGAGSLLSLAASDLDQQGDFYAGLVDGALQDNIDFSLEVDNSFRNSGTFYLANDLFLNVNNFANSDGQLAVLGDLNVDANENFDNSLGSIKVEGSSALINARNITNTEGQISYLHGEGELLIHAHEALINDAGEIYSSGRLEIDADTVSNHQGTVLADAAFIEAGEWDNLEGLLQFQTLDFTADNVNNHTGQLVINAEDAGSAIQVTHEFDNTQGLVYSAGSELTLAADSLINNQGDLVVADGLLDMLIDDELSNSGQIQADTIQLQARTLNNDSGTLLADTISANAETLQNTGIIQSYNLSLSGNHYESNGGTLLSLGDNDLSVQFSDSIENLDGARIEAQGAGGVRLSAGVIDNAGGQILSETDVSVDATQLSNEDGYLSANDITLDVRSIDNREGSIVAQDALNLTARQLNNADGLLYSDSSFSLRLTGAEGLDNRSGIIRSAQGLALDVSGDLYNQQGLLHAGDNLTISAGNIFNQSGQLVADNIHLTAAAVENLGESLIEADFLSVDANVLSNEGNIVIASTGDNAFELNVNDFINRGFLDVHTHDLNLTGINYITEGGEIYHRGLGELYINTGTHFDNRSGSLVTAGTLRLDAEHIDNRGGSLIAGSGLDMDLLSFNNEGGYLQAGNAFSLTLDTLNNRGGTIITAGDLPSHLNVSGVLDNTGGAIYYDGSANLSVVALSLDNTEGFLGGVGDLDITTIDTLTNTDGQIVSGGAITIESQAIANLGESRIEAQRLTLTADTLENQGMVLAADAAAEEALQFTVGSIHNAGLIESLGINLDFSGSVLNNQGGEVVHRGLGALRIEQAEFNQQDAGLFSLGHVTVNADTVNQVNSYLAAGEGLQITAGSVNQQNAQIQAGGLVQWQSQSLSQDADSSLVFLADSDASLEVLELQNAGVISAAGNLLLDVDTIVNTALGTIEANSLSVEASAVDNAGQIAAGEGFIQVGSLVNQANARMDFGSAEISFDEFTNDGLLLAFDEFASGLTLTGDNLTNTGVVENQGAQLTITASAMENQGQIVSSNNANLTITDIDNHDGVIHADASLQVTGDALDNTAGLLRAQQLQLQAGTLLNNGGTLVAGGITVSADSLDNTEGAIAGTDTSGSFMLDIAGLLDNQLGLIQSDNASAHIHAITLQNTGGDILHRGEGTLQVDAESLHNSEQGSLVSFGDLAITAQSLENDQASIQATGDIDIQSSQLINRGGVIAAENHTRITATSVQNSSVDETVGRIYGQWLTLDFDALVNSGRVDGSSVTLTGLEADNAGQIIAYGTDDHALSIATTNLNNSGHLESAGHLLQFEQTELINSGDILHRGEGALIFDQESLTNSGTIASLADITLQAQQFDNSDGTLVGMEGASLTITANTISNDRGQLNADTLMLDAMSLSNVLGEVSGQQVTLQSAGINNIGGKLIGNTLDITAYNLRNENHTGDEVTTGYISGQQVTLNAQLLGNSGVMQGEQLNIQGDYLDNSDGLVLATGTEGESLQLAVNSIKNQQGLLESAGESLTFTGFLDNNEGNVTLASEGRLQLADVINDNNGHIASLGDIVIQHNGNFSNQGGVVQANGALGIEVDNVLNQGGKLVAGGVLGIDAQYLDNRNDGLILARSEDDNSLQLNIAGDLDNRSGIIESHARNLTMGIGNLLNDDGELYHLGSGVLTINAEGDQSTGVGVIASSGSIAVNATGAFTNEGQISANHSLDFSAASFSNLLGALVNAENLSIDAGTSMNTGNIQAERLQLGDGDFTNSGTEIVPGEWDGGRVYVTGTESDSLVLGDTRFHNLTGGVVQLTADNLQIDAEFNNHGGTLVGMGAGVLSFTQLDNTGGSVFAVGDVSIEQLEFINNGGAVRADGDLAITVEHMDNLDGEMQALGALNLQAGSLDNTGGSLVALDAFSVNVSGLLDNTQGSLVSEADTMWISAGELNNTLGYIEHRGAQALVLETITSLNNNGGQINAAGSLTLDVNEILNNALGDDTALINAADLYLTAQTLENRGGYIQGRDSLSLNMPTIDNRGGNIISLGEANNAFTLTTDHFDNREQGGLSIASTDFALHNITFDNRGGTLDHRGDGQLWLSGDHELANAGGRILSQGDVQLDFASVDNQAGTITGQTLLINATGDINNSHTNTTEGGGMVADAITINAAQLNNHAGMLGSRGVGDNTLALNVDFIDNSLGLLRNSSTNWLFTLEGINNEGGSVVHTGGGLFQLQHDAHLDVGGTIATTGDMQIDVGSLTNSGSLLSDGDLSITSTGNIANSGSESLIRAGSALDIQGGGDFSNAGGITAMTDIDVIVTGILNNSGLIVTDAEDATLAASQLDNSGVLAHNGTGIFSITADSITNNTTNIDAVATIKSGGTLQISTPEITNGGVISADIFSVLGFNSITGLADSRIEAGSILFQGNSLNNQGTLVSSNSGDSLSMQVASLNNSGTFATNNTNLSFTGDVINSGDIVHAGTGVLKLGEAGLVDITGGRVSTSGRAELTGGITGAGELSAQTGITISGFSTFVNSGSQLYTQGNIQLNAALDNRNGSLIADGSLRIDTTGEINNSSGRLQGGSVRIDAGTVRNTSGGQIYSSGGTSGYIRAGSVQNNGGTIAVNNNTFDISASSIYNSNGTIVQQGGSQLNLNAYNTISNINGGKIQTVGALDLTADTLTNSQGGKITAATFDIDVDTLTNSGTSEIISRGTGNNVIAADTFTNTGLVSSYGTGLEISVADTLDNTGGTLEYTGSGEFGLLANTLLNGSADSTIQSEGGLFVVTPTLLDNYGTIGGRYGLTFQVPELLNRGTGVINSAEGIVTINTPNNDLTNQGTISAGEGVSITADLLLNSGAISSDNFVYLDLTALSMDGSIEAKRLLDITVDESVVIAAGESLASEGNLYLETGGDITNHGDIKANNVLWLSGGQLTNTGEITAGVFDGQNYFPYDALLPHYSTLDFSVGISNTGQIASRGNLAISAPQITNSHQITAGQELALLGSNIVNGGDAVIFSGGNMVFGFNGVLENNGGDIFSLGNLYLDDRDLNDHAVITLNDNYDHTSAGNGGTVINAGGRIEALGNAFVNVEEIYNTRTGPAPTYVTGETVTERERSGGTGYPVLDFNNTIDYLTWGEGDRPQRGDEGATYERFYNQTETTQYVLEVDDASQNAVFFVGGTLRLSDTDFQNHLATVSVGGDLIFEGDSSYNQVTMQDYEVVTSEVRKEYHFEFVTCSGADQSRSCTGLKTGWGYLSENVVTQDPRFHGEALGVLNVAGNMPGNADGSMVFQVLTAENITEELSDNPYLTGPHNAGSQPGRDAITSALVNAPGHLGELGERDLNTGSANTGHDGQVLGNNESLLYGDRITGRDKLLEGIGEFNPGEGLSSRASDAVDYAMLNNDRVLVGEDAQGATAQDFSLDAARGLQEDVVARYTTRPELVIEEDWLIDAEGEDIDSDGDQSATDPNAPDPNGEGGVDAPDETETLDPEAQPDQLAAFEEKAKELGKVVVVTSSGEYVMVDPSDPRAAEDYDPTPATIETLPGNYNLGNLSGLFVVNPDPDSNYLIESRPEYTEYTNFLGSDYLLQQLGYNPDKTIKRLGDAFYENQLVRDALINQATVGFDDSEGDPMQRLMDNAVAANQSLNLRVGIALSAAQVSQLTEDMVWLVEETVNGETVLVPRVYLASVSEGDLLAQNNALRVGGDVNLRMEGDIDLGANVASRGDMSFSAGGDLTQSENIFSHSNIWLDAGGDLSTLGSVEGDLVELTAGGNIDNLGELNADRGLWLDAGGSIINHSVGSMTSTGVLNLHAVDDIINQQGYMEGVDVTLTTERGDIINRTEFEQSTHHTEHGVHTTTRVGEDSIIVSHNSLLMDAGNNIDIQGSSLSALGDISLNAGNDVLMGAVENKNAYSVDLGSFSASRERTTYQVVDINAGGNLVIGAGRDIVGEGTQLSAGGSALLNAERDINLSAVANVDHSAFARKDYERSDTVVTHTQAALNVGGSAQLNAGQDINLTGANILADGNISLHAERDTNILAVTDSEHHYLYERDDKSFGRSETYEAESRTETNVGSTLAAGGSVMINLQVNQSEESGEVVSLLPSRNVTIQGSNIIAGSGTVGIGAGEDITLTAGANSHAEFERRSSSGLGGITGRSNEEANASVTHVGTQVSAGEDVVMVSGRDTTLVASGVQAENNIRIEAGVLDEEGSVNLLSLNDSTYHNEESSSRSFSLSADFESVSWSKEEAERNSQMNEQVNGSMLVAGNDVNVTAAQDINLQGSLIQADNNVGLDAGRDINVLAATAQSTYSASREETRSEMSLTTDSNGVTFFDGDRTEETSQEGTVNQSFGSLISAGGSVDAKAGNDITIAGSTVLAEDEINLVAVNNVNIVNSLDGASSTSEESLTLDGLTIRANHNIGNAVDAISDLGSGDNAVSDASGVMEAVDAIGSVGASVSAHVGQTTTTTGTTNTSEEALGSHLGAGGNINITAGETATVTGSTLDTGNDINVTASDINILAADNTYGTTYSSDYLQVGATLQVSDGNASLTAGFSSSESEQSNQTITNTGSQLLADGNINLTATDELTVTGSELAGTDINLAGNNVTINASQGLLQSSSDSEHLSAGAGINFGSDGIGFTANMAMGESELDSTTLTNQNSQIDASGNLNITSANDTTIAGANLQGGTVNMNVGNNLTVASVQDIGTVEGEQWDVSLSVTVGAGASVGASVGYGETEGSSAWVNEQTSIIGTDAVNINVGGHTQIDGALIANIDEEGVDQGNLLLNTGTLGYSDIEDHDEYESFYLNVGFSTGGTSGANSNTGASQDESGSSWSVEGNYGSHDYEQTNHATVGNGQIIVRDDPNVDLSGLNRDVTTAQEATREDSTEVELYVSSTAIDAIDGLVSGDDPDTPQNEDTLEVWQDNITGLVSAETYGQMLDNVAELGNVEEIKESWGVVTERLGEIFSIDKELTPEEVQALIPTLNIGVSTGPREPTEQDLELIAGLEKLANFIGEGDEGGLVGSILWDNVIELAWDFENAGPQAVLAMLNEAVFSPELSDLVNIDILQDQVMGLNQIATDFDSTVGEAANIAHAGSAVFRTGLEINDAIGAYVGRGLRGGSGSGAAGTSTTGTGGARNADEGNGNNQVNNADAADGEMGSPGQATELGEGSGGANTLPNNLEIPNNPFATIETSSGISIQPQEGVTTTVLGSYGKDMGNIIDEQLKLPDNMNYTEANPGGFNILNTPNDFHRDLGPERFWYEVNVPFLESAIERGDEIYLATEPTGTVLRNPNSWDGLSGFGREYEFLTERGYVYDPTTGRMCLGGCD